MKKQYLASLTIASLLLSIIAAMQTGIAVENEVKTQEVAQVLEPNEANEMSPTPAPVQAVPEVVETSEIQETMAPEEAQNSPRSTDSVSEVQESVPDVNPYDVEPFPPNVPSDDGPAINLIPVQSIRKGDSFDPMVGVTATDKIDGDITASITYTGSVDVDVAGQYSIVYSVTNSRGQRATQLAVINVEETNVGMYSIELPDFSLTIGSDYIQAIRERIVIKDADGNIIPTSIANIVVSSHHSTDKVGKIAVEVAVLSTYNTVTKKIVTITLTDESSVRIDANDVILKIGDSFDPYDYAKGFSTDVHGVETPMSQAADASSSGVFVLSNDVDTNEAGTYHVTYQVKNDSGKVVTKTITVIVSTVQRDRVPTILVEDKVMYVGNKLTKEMILAWASTENPNDFITGFEVLNGKIKVKFFDDTLVEPGVHEIMFYATTTEGKTSKKSMTLTVKNQQTPVEGNGSQSPSETSKEEPTKEVESVQTILKETNTVTMVKTEPKGVIKSVAINKKTLPQTGERTNNVFLTLIGLLMSTGAATFHFKRNRLNKM